MDRTSIASGALEDAAIVSLIKRHFAPDGAAEREHNAAGGSLGFGAIHYSLVVNHRPRRALVIGSRHGYIPAIIALALKFNGSGTLDFVDAGYSDAGHGFATAYGGVGHWQADSSGWFTPLGIGDHLRVHVMRSADFFARCDASYGYVYLDGNHSYEGCRDDFEQALTRLEEGGFIVLHDVAVDHQGFGVAKLFGELDPKRFEKLRLGAWPGLGIVQVRMEPM